MASRPVSRHSVTARTTRAEICAAESQENKEALARAREEIEHLISRSEAAEDKLRKLGQQLDSAKAQHEQDYERLREQVRPSALHLACAHRLVG